MLPKPPVCPHCGKTDSTVRPHVAQRVEDSHAKLAAEMRDAGKPGHIFPEGMRHTSGLKTAMREWAARVEALGRAEEKKAAFEKEARALASVFVNQWSKGEPAVADFVPMCDAFRALVESESASKKEDA